MIPGTSERRVFFLSNHTEFNGVQKMLTIHFKRVKKPYSGLGADVNIETNIGSYALWYMAWVLERNLVQFTLNDVESSLYIESIAFVSH